ncbi:MAG: TIGR01459 family HAD-type hydrolase [Parachlamydia sp.]|nr:TIGR01459 family HAD-type hydrolase [Parachlamydia sp.]
MQTQIYSSLAEIVEPYPAVCLDAYGVFWGGAGILPGAAEAMQKLVKSGKIVGILSNSTQLAEKEIAKLSTHGMRKGEHFHFLLTSGEVTRRIALEQNLPFPTPRHTYFVVCRNHPKSLPHQSIFQNTPYTEIDNIQEADFLYVGIPHLDGNEQTDPAVFQEEVDRLKAFNLPMLCANPDRFAPAGAPGRFVVTQGSIAELYRALGGEVFYIGKPSPKVFEAALEQFQHHLIESKTVLMVGDTPETDVRGALSAGMIPVLVTHTGNMAHRIREQGFEKAIQALPSTDQPHFYIKQLGSHGI